MSAGPIGEGPSLIRHLNWVQLSTVRVRGGIAGRPLEFIDIADQILASVKEHDRTWELPSESWSVQGVFEDEPVKVLHLPNPFRLVTEV